MQCNAGSLPHRSDRAVPGPTRSAPPSSKMGGERAPQRADGRRRAPVEDPSHVARREPFAALRWRTPSAPHRDARRRPYRQPRRQRRAAGRPSGTRRSLAPLPHTTSACSSRRIVAARGPQLGHAEAEPRHKTSSTASSRRLRHTGSSSAGTIEQLAELACRQHAANGRTACDVEPDRRVVLDPFLRHCPLKQGRIDAACGRCCGGRTARREVRHVAPDQRARHAVGRGDAGPATHSANKRTSEE